MKNGETKLLKYWWTRDDTVPAGISAKGRFSCCSNSPLVDLVEGGADIICLSCGARYSWDGAIKGRSVGSETLTAYRVIFEDGSEYATSMSADTNLQRAFYYFINRTIDGKRVSDVIPC